MDGSVPWASAATRAAGGGRVVSEDPDKVLTDDSSLGYRTRAAAIAVIDSEPRLRDHSDRLSAPSQVTRSDPQEAIMADTLYSADLADGGEISTGKPCGFSGKGANMIPILEIHGRHSGIYSWLPLTATAEEQQAAVDAAAAEIDSDHG